MKRYFLITAITIVTLFFMCMYFINPRVEYSPLENRNMSMFSTIKNTSFAAGTLQTNLEEALKDQIFLRDSFIMYYSNIKGESRRYFNQTLKFFENAGEFIKDIFSSDNGSQIPSETTSVPTTFEAQTSTFPSDTSTSTTTSVGPTTFEAQTSTFPSDTSTSTPTSVDPTTSEAQTGTLPSDTSTSTTTSVGPTTSDTSTSATTSVASTTATPTTTETTKFWLEPSGNIYKINGTDQLTYYPFLDNYAKKSNYMIFAKQISLLATRHPDVKVYAYYITKTEDLNWFDKSEKIRTFDYASFLFSYLSEDVRFDKFEINSMSDVMDYLYRTDHHWNHAGADKGYNDIISMIKSDLSLPEIRTPVKELDFTSASRPDGVFWYGSKYKASGGAKVSAPDSFKAYDYGLAGRYVAYYGNSQRDIGLAEQYAAGNINTSLLFDHYVQYYGYAGDLIRYQYPENTNGYNLLVIGDSNNRPIRKVLGSHFYNFYFIEKRILNKYDVDSIITNNEIDAVLFLGEADFWEMYRLPGYPQK